MTVYAKFIDRKGFTSVQQVPYPPPHVWTFAVSPRFTSWAIPDQALASLPVELEKVVFERQPGGSPENGFEYMER